MCHLLGRATLAPDLFTFSELRALPRPTECTSPSAGMLCFATQSCLFVTPWTGACQAPLSVGFSRQEHWSGLPCPPPGDLTAPPGFPHCRWILYHLSHQGRPEIPEWVAYPFSRGSSQPRNWTRVSCIAGGFFTHWAIRKVDKLFQDCIVWLFWLCAWLCCSPASG